MSGRDAGVFHEPPPPPEGGALSPLDESARWGEIVAGIDPGEWRDLPGGGKVHLPSLGGGCPGCGATIFDIKAREHGGGLCCPNCVPPRPGPRPRGRFDLATGEVVRCR